MSADEFQQILQSISTLKTEFSTQFAQLDQRLTQLESGGSSSGGSSVPNAGSATDHVDVHVVNQPLDVRIPTSLPHPDSGFGAVDSDTLQHWFTSIKDSHSGVCLPDDLYFAGRAQGLDTKYKDTAAVLNSSAHFVETALKVTGALQETLSQEPDAPARPIADDLMITLVVLLHHLQEKHAGLVVAGTYRPKAKKLFDSIGSGVSVIGHPQILQHVETVTKLTAFQPREEQCDFDSRGPSASPFRHPFRGGWRPSRGGFHNNSSNFSRGRGRGDYSSSFPPNHDFGMDRDESSA